MCVAARNRKKFTKKLYFRGSKSIKVIDVDTNKKLVTTAISVEICAASKNCEKSTKNPFFGKFKVVQAHRC